MTEVEAFKCVTAEFVGKGEPVCDLPCFKERRSDILDRLSWLGNGLTPGQRNNFTFFKEEWDSRCAQVFGNAWPDLFLWELNGVLKRMETDPWAFSKFMHKEERDVCSGTKALLVPGRPV